MTTQAKRGNYLTVEAGEYPCGNNLYLIVAPSGARRWRFNYQRNGVKSSMGFGSARDVNWDEAQANAINARRELAAGIDPKAKRDETRRADGCPLFGPFATDWQETFAKSLKHKSSRQKLKRTVEVYCKALHKMRLDEIGTDQIVKLVLEPIRAKKEIARDTRQVLKRIFNAAIACGHRGQDNPADYETRLKPIMGRAPKRGRRHHKGIGYHDLPALMRKFADAPDLSARALEVLTFTVARTAEIMNMRWTQLDLGAGVWTIEAADLPEDTDGGEGTKNDCDKVTPLSRQALAILRELAETRVCEYVFPGRDLRNPMSNNTMLKRIKEISGDSTLTVHGLRGTFRTWGQDETDYDRETLEHCMHHILGDAAERAYKHGKALRKRLEILQAWSDFATSRGKGKVVPLIRAA